jgi:hypothetical protein
MKRTWRRSITFSSATGLLAVPFASSSSTDRPPQHVVPSRLLAGCITIRSRPSSILQIFYRSGCTGQGRGVLRSLPLTRRSFNRASRRIVVDSSHPSQHQPSVRHRQRASASLGPRAFVQGSGRTRGDDRPLSYPWPPDGSGRLSGQRTCVMHPVFLYVPSAPRRGRRPENRPGCTVPRTRDQ